MYRLRALKFSLLFGLFATAVWGISHSVYSTVEIDYRNGPLDVVQLDRVYNVSRVSETIGYRAEQLVGGINAQAAVIVSQPDYSSFIIRDALGGESLLSDQVSYKNEVAGELSLDWASGSHFVSLGWTGSVSESPFASQSASVIYNKSFFNNATIIGVQGTYLHQKAPENYFLGDEGSQARPTEVNGYEVILSGEQTLTENWKVLAKLGLSQRIEERPKNISVSLTQAYALTDRIFADLELNYVSELSSDPLKDDRGYFRNYGFRIGLSVEPIYDLLISASYGLLVERESDPRLDREVQVAGDQFGLGMGYRLSNLELSLKGAYVQTNHQVQNVNVSGGVTWQL